MHLLMKRDNLISVFNRRQQLLVCVQSFDLIRRQFFTQHIHHTQLCGTNQIRELCLMSFPYTVFVLCSTGLLFSLHSVYLLLFPQICTFQFHKMPYKPKARIRSRSLDVPLSVVLNPARQQHYQSALPSAVQGPDLSLSLQAEADYQEIQSSISLSHYTKMKGIRPPDAFCVIRSSIFMRCRSVNYLLESLFQA